LGSARYHDPSQHHAPDNNTAATRCDAAGRDGHGDGDGMSTS
jgi:hypothetical protein